MAKIEICRVKIRNRVPNRWKPSRFVHGRGGGKWQHFLIGSGLNFDATSVIVLEIIYSVNGVQFFYTRNYLHQIVDLDVNPYYKTYFDKFRLGEADALFWGYASRDFDRLKRR